MAFMLKLKNIRIKTSCSRPVKQTKRSLVENTASNLRIGWFYQCDGSTAIGSARELLNRIVDRIHVPKRRDRRNARLQLGLRMKLAPKRLKSLGAESLRMQETSR